MVWDRSWNGKGSDSMGGLGWDSDGVGKDVGWTGVGMWFVWSKGGLGWGGGGFDMVGVGRLWCVCGGVE